MPEVNDELKFEPATEPVNGVQTSDLTEMVETLITVGETMDSHEEPVELQIVNVHRLLTDEEIFELDTLTVRERLLTVLAALGYADQVDETLREKEEILSDEAMALREEILNRISEMDEEELAEYKRILEEYFHLEVLEDEVAELYIIIELEISRDGKTRVERYGFRQEDEEWILTKLEIAEIL